MSLLEVQSVSVVFGGLVAVKKVNLTIRKGEIVGLIGPNGAGKTTLFNAVTRLQELSGGKVWLGRTEVTKMPAADAALLDTSQMGIEPAFAAALALVSPKIENALISPA